MFRVNRESDSQTVRKTGPELWWWDLVWQTNRDGGRVYNVDSHIVVSMGWREVGIESMRWLRAWEQWLFKLTWTVLYNLLKLRSGTSALHLFFFTCWPSSSTLVSSQTEWHVTGWIQRGQQIHLPLVEPLIGHIALPWPLHYRQQTHRCISHALTPQVQHAEPSTFFHLVPSEMADANTIMLLTSTSATSAC